MRGEKASDVLTSLDALELESPVLHHHGAPLSALTPGLRAAPSPAVGALRRSNHPSTGSPLVSAGGLPKHALAPLMVSPLRSGGGGALTKDQNLWTRDAPSALGGGGLSSAYSERGELASGGGESVSSVYSSVAPSAARERGWNNRFGTKASLVSHGAAGLHGAGWRQGGGRSPYSCSPAVGDASPSPYSPLMSNGSPAQGGAMGGATRDERRIRSLVEQREAYVDILAAMLASATTARHSWPLPHEAQALGRCLHTLRRTSVLVVERIVQWQREKSFGRPFMWEGEPYLQTMKQDLEFMAQLPVLARASEAVPDLRKLFTRNLAYVPEGQTGRRIKQLDPVLSDAPLPGVSKARLKRARRLVVELGGTGGSYRALTSMSSKEGGAGAGESAVASASAATSAARPVVRAAELMVGLDVAELEQLAELGAPPVALLLLVGGVGLVVDVGGGKSARAAAKSDAEVGGASGGNATASVRIDARALSMGWDELRKRLLCDAPALILRMQRVHALSAPCATALRTHLDHVSLRPERLAALEGTLDGEQGGVPVSEVAEKVLRWLHLLLRASGALSGEGAAETKVGLSTGGGASNTPRATGADDVAVLREEIALLREHLQLFMTTPSPEVAAKIAEASRASAAAAAAQSKAALASARASAAQQRRAAAETAAAAAQLLPAFRAQPMQLLLTEMRWLKRVAPAVVSVWLDGTALLIEMRELRAAELSAWNIGGVAGSAADVARDEELEAVRAKEDKRFADADIDDSASSDEEAPIDPYALVGAVVGGVAGAAPWRPLGEGAPVWESSSAGGSAAGRQRGDRAIAPPLRVLEPHSLSILGLSPTSIAALHYDDRTAYLGRLLRLLQWQYWKQSPGSSLAFSFPAVRGAGGSAAQQGASAAATAPKKRPRVVLRLAAPLALLARGRRIAIKYTAAPGGTRALPPPAPAARAGDDEDEDESAGERRATAAALPAGPAHPGAHLFAFVRVEALGLNGTGLRITVMPAASHACGVPGAVTSIAGNEVDAMLLCYAPELLAQRSTSWAGYCAVAQWVAARLVWSVTDLVIAAPGDVEAVVAFGAPQVAAGSEARAIARGETLLLNREVSDALPLTHIPGHPAMPLRADVPEGLGALRLHCGDADDASLSVLVSAIEIQALCWGVVDSPVYPSDPPPKSASELLLRLLGRLSLAGPRLALNRSMIQATCGLLTAPSAGRVASAERQRITLVAETLGVTSTAAAAAAAAIDPENALSRLAHGGYSGASGAGASFGDDGLVVRFSGWRTHEARPTTSGECEFKCDVTYAQLRALACGSHRRERQLFHPTALPALAYFATQNRFRLCAIPKDEHGVEHGDMLALHDAHATISVKVILREGSGRQTNVGTIELAPPGRATLAELRASIGSLRDAARLKLVDSEGFSIYVRGAVVERANEARCWLVDCGSFVEIRRGAAAIPLDEDEATRRVGERAARRVRLDAKKRARRRRRRGKIPRYLRPKGWKPKKRLTKAQRRLQAQQCAAFALKDVVQLAWERFQVRRKVRLRREKRAGEAKAKYIPHCVATIEHGSCELTVTRDLRLWGVKPGSLLMVGDRVVCVRVKSEKSDELKAAGGTGLTDANGTASDLHLMKGAQAAVDAALLEESAAGAVGPAGRKSRPGSAASSRSKSGKKKGGSTSRPGSSASAERPGSASSAKSKLGSRPGSAARPDSSGSKRPSSSASRRSAGRRSRPGTAGSRASRGSRRSKRSTAAGSDSDSDDSDGAQDPNAAPKRPLTPAPVINIDDLPAIEADVVRLEMGWLDDTESSVELPVWLLPVVATTSLEATKKKMMKKLKKWKPASLKGTRGMDKVPTHRGISVSWAKLEKLLTLGKDRGHQSPIDFTSRVKTEFVLNALYDNMTNLMDNGGWTLSRKKYREREALDGTILLKFVRGLGLLRPTPGQPETFIYQKAEIKALKKHPGPTVAMACGLGVDKISLDILFARCRNSEQRALNVMQYKKILLPDLASISFPFLRPKHQMAHIIANHVYKWGPVEQIIWTEATRLAAVAESWNYCAAVRMQVWVRVAHAKRRLTELRYQQALETACVIRSQSAIRMIFERRRLAARLLHARQEKKRQLMMAARRRAAKKAGLLYCEVMTADSLKYVISINRLSARNVRVRMYKADSSFVQDFHVTETKLREICELDDEAPKSQLFATQAMLMFCAKLRLRMRGDSKVFILVRHASANHGDRLCRKSCRIGDIRDDPLVATGIPSDAGYLLVVTIYQQHGDYFFHIYEPDTCGESGSLTLSSTQLIEWLRVDKMTDLLKRDERDNLCIWLMERLRCQHNKKGERVFMLEIERRAQIISLKASKLQAAFRSKRARNQLKKMAMRMWRKEWDMMAHAFFYANISTHEARWTKPLVLGSSDAPIAPDKWELRKGGDGSEYYYNPRTGQSSWLTLPEAAVLLQRAWIRKKAKDFAVTDWSTMIRCLLVQKRARPAYYAAPHKLSSCLNFALYLHGLHDGTEPEEEDEEMVAERLEGIGVTSIEDAAPWTPVTSATLYDRALELAPEQPIALFGKAILMLESAAYPRKKLWRLAQSMISDARALDPERKCFAVAEQAFFYWRLVVEPGDATAMLRYALLHQCINNDFPQAEKWYAKGLLAEPTNKYLRANYNDYMSERASGMYSPEALAAQR